MNESKWRVLSASVLSFCIFYSFYTLFTLTFLSALLPLTPAPEITQSQDYESCYLFFPSLPASPTSTIPLTIVWQSEQSRENKGAGQVFKEENVNCQSDCDVRISVSHQTSILKERRKRKRNRAIGWRLFNQTKGNGEEEKNERAAQVHAR